MKTADLIGPALDWAVCKALGLIDMNIEIGLGKTTAKAVVIDEYGLLFDMRYGVMASPSTNWAQGGPIIEREQIGVSYWPDKEWQAQGFNYGFATYSGSHPLVAAMRCYVASKMGNEIEIPEELK